MAQSGEGRSFFRKPITVLAVGDVEPAGWGARTAGRMTGGSHPPVVFFLWLLTERLIQSIIWLMPRRSPAERLPDVAAAAMRVFRANGYRRTLMADVAVELGL